MSQFAGQGNEFIHDFGSVRVFTHTPIVAGFETLVKLVAKSGDKTVILATRMNMESSSWGAQILVMSVDG